MTTSTARKPREKPLSRIRDVAATEAMQESSRAVLAKQLPTVAKKLVGYAKAIKAAHADLGNAKKVDAAYRALDYVRTPREAFGEHELNNLIRAALMVTGEMYVSTSGDSVDTFFEEFHEKTVRNAS